MQSILEDSAITNFMQQKSTRYQLRHWALSSASKSYFLLNLSQHCHKSVFPTTESSLFTAFPQKPYQVFFLGTSPHFTSSGISIFPRCISVPLAMESAKPQASKIPCITYFLKALPSRSWSLPHKIFSRPTLYKPVSGNSGFSSFSGFCRCR